MMKVMTVMKDDFHINNPAWLRIEKFRNLFMCALACTRLLNANCIMYSVLLGWY